MSGVHFSVLLNHSTDNLDEIAKAMPAPVDIYHIGRFGHKYLEPYTESMAWQAATIRGRSRREF